jgi:hypothetical protein
MKSRTSNPDPETQKVAFVRRKFPEGPLTFRQVANRALHLPVFLLAQVDQFPQSPVAAKWACGRAFFGAGISGPD